MIRLLAICLVWAGFANTEPLRIGTESDYRPYIFMDDAGQRIGFDADLVDLICARGGFECTWVEIEFAQLFNGVAIGLYDIAIGGVGVSPERDVLVDWTQPYRAHNNSAVRLAGLSDTIDVLTARIGVVGGTKHESVLIDAGYTPVPFENNQAIYSALIADEIDVFAVSTDYLAGLVADGEDRLVDLGSIDYFSAGAQIAVTKTKPELRDQLNLIIDDLRSDGALRRLERKWFPTNSAQDL